MEDPLALLTSDMLRSFLDAHERFKNYATDTLDAFNYFMSHMLRHMVDENCRVNVTIPPAQQGALGLQGAVRHAVTFSNVTVEKPTVAGTEGAARGLRVVSAGGDPLTPHEALLRGLTYSASVYVDMRHEVWLQPPPLADGTQPPERALQEPLVYRNLFLFAMPIAVGSEFCNTFDPTAPAGNECSVNKGGYWIVRGNMKVVQPQKQQRHNFHIVRHATKGGIEAQIRSIRPDEKFRSTSTLDLALYAGNLTISIPFLKANQPVVAAFRLLGFHAAEDIERLVWPGGAHALPANAAARRLLSGAFGHELATCPMERLMDVLGATLPGSGSGADANPDKVRKQVLQQVCGELLPHVGFDDSPLTRLKKGLYLGIIVRRMLAVSLGDEAPDERDFEGFKFLQSCASTLAILFRQLFGNFNKVLRNRIFDLVKKGKHVDVAALIMRADTMPQLHTAFSDGEVTVQKESSNAGTKVIQLVQQVNMLSLPCHVERVNTPVNRDGKYPMMRNIDPTSLFSTCPTKTPEGDGAGLLQTLTIMSHVRVGTPSADVRGCVLGLGAFAAHHPEARAVCSEEVPPHAAASPAFVRPLLSLDDCACSSSSSSSSTLVFVNSDPIALTDFPADFLKVCRAARRAQVLPYDCTIVRALHGILVTTDMGVITFPLIYLPNLPRLPQALAASKLGGTNLWRELMRHGIVEYVDAWETMEYVVAFLPEDIRRARDSSSGHGAKDGAPYTHLAPHPCSFFSTAAGTIPFANHNQAPRNTYQAGMCEQAIGSPALNVADRHDMNYSHMLWYPQKPLCTTHIAEVKGVNEWPMGQNCMVAIAPYGGLSQEDAIVVSKAARERGLQRITVFRSHRETARRKGGGDAEVFEHPQAPSDLPTIGVRGQANYDTVGLDGLPEVGARVTSGDVLIGKVSTSASMGADGKMQDARRDRSELLHCDPSERHTVHAVMVTDNRDGARFVRVRTRATRDLDEADKISDRHGQKGTVGALVAQEDLPYVAHGPNAGMVPDLIVNLQAINGRMTIGKLLEMLFGAVGVASGTLQDATPFLEVDARGAMDDLLKSGYGVEHTMISGITGEPLRHPWFIGPCFYQRLKHMVLDKIAARARGMRAVLTRQPIEGRANQGGQKMGGMEVDSLIAHGASMVLDDRNRVVSDSFKAPVCKSCGALGKVDDHSLAGMMLTGATRTCRACGSADLTVLDSTYCYAGLLLGELEAMGIGVKHKYAATAGSSAASAESHDDDMASPPLTNIVSAMECVDE
jgi:DNA-directed RNA polymerase II subunit RPB2